MKHRQQILLTIAIPTFNRASEIKGLLGQIFGFEIRDICVIVSDNGSSDDTIKECMCFEKYDNFSLIQNNTNLGFDQNLHRLINAASSKYIWFLSDDDRVTKELVLKVIRLCKANSYASLLIDAQVVKKHSPETIIIDSLANGVDDYIVENVQRIDPDIFLWSTLLSSIVVRREHLSLEMAKLAIGSNFSPLAIYWLVSHNRSSYYLTSSKLTKRDGNASAFGAADSFVWLNGMILARKFLYSYGFDLQNIEDAVASIFKKGLFNQSGIVAHYLLSRIKHKPSHQIRLTDVYNVSSPSRMEKVAIALISVLSSQILMTMYKLSKPIIKQIRQINA